MSWNEKEKEAEREGERGRKKKCETLKICKKCRFIRSSVGSRGSVYLIVKKIIQDVLDCRNVFITTGA